MSEDRVVIFSSSNLAQAHLVRSALTREGIVSFLRKPQISNLSSDGLFDGLRVKLKVASADVGRALDVLRDACQPLGPDWTCGACGEGNPANFELCWRCQEPMT